MSNNKKVLNAKKVDINGKHIVKLAEWKLEHPDEIYFDSEFEWKAAMLFQEMGIKYTFQPEPFEIVPKFETVTFDYGPEDKKEYNKLKRGKKGREKGAVTREFGKTHSKVVTPMKYARPLTWSTDFYLDDFDIFVEIKGNPNDVFPVKLKLIQYVFPQHTFIVIYTMKDLREFVNYLLKQKQS